LVKYGCSAFIARGVDVCTKFASHICLLCNCPQRRVKQTTDKLSLKYFVPRYAVLIFQVQFKDFVTNHSLLFLKCFRIREQPIWGISKKSESKNHWVSWKNQQRTSGIMGDYLTFSKKLRNIVGTTRACGARDMCHYLMLNCHFSVIYVTITITLLYIVMDKTTKFASHICHVLLRVWEKSHSHIMFIIPMTDVEHFFVKLGLTVLNSIFQNFESWGISVLNTSCVVHCSSSPMVFYFII
jgi:hypothetical protein